MIEQYLRSKSSQKTWLWAPQLCASSKPFLNCNFLFYPTHSNIKLRNPFRDYVIWHHYFTGGSIETCHCNKARIRTQAKPRPINYFTGLISPQIMWLASSFKSFPTQTILLPQSINPHCHISLSLCQEITFSILQALDNWLLYFHFQRVTSIFLDWCSSLSYSHFLWQKFKKKKKKQKGQRPPFPKLHSPKQPSKQPGVYWPSLLNLVYLVTLVTRATFPNRNFLFEGPFWFHSGSRRAHQSLDLASRHSDLHTGPICLK